MVRLAFPAPCQMAFWASRNATMRAPRRRPRPPRSRPGTATRSPATSMISWRAPAAPTWPSRPRSATRHGVDGLGLRRHDPLERRVARLDDAGGDGHDGGQRAGHLVEARLGLALDAHRRAVDRDGLRERHRRQAEQLGELHGRRAGVAVRRLGRGEHEVELGALDRRGEDLGRAERVGPLRARVADRIALAAPIASAVRSPPVSPFGAMDTSVTSPPPAASASWSAISTP